MCETTFVKTNNYGPVTWMFSGSANSHKISVLFFINISTRFTLPRLIPECTSDLLTFPKLTLFNNIEPYAEVFVPRQQWTLFQKELLLESDSDLPISVVKTVFTLSSTFNVKFLEHKPGYHAARL